MAALDSTPRRPSVTLRPLLLLLVALACDQHRSLPTEPIVRSSPPAPPTAPPLAEPLGVSEPATPGTYWRVNPDSSSSTSRFMIDPTGRFLLQEMTGNSIVFEVGGAYARSGDWYRFDLDMWSKAGPLFGDVAFIGACLDVRWNGVALMTDFEDGRFCR